MAYAQRGLEVGPKHAHDQEVRPHSRDLRGHHSQARLRSNELAFGDQLSERWCCTSRWRARMEGLNSSLRRNIEALRQRRAEEEASASFQERLASKITRFTGSMRFVYLHLALFGFWIAANLGWIPGVPAWDPSFVVLAMIASVEAIFLSTFVLISQNRMSAAADKRADLDLQVSLLAEHEVTRLVTLVSAI